MEQDSVPAPLTNNSKDMSEGQSSDLAANESQNISRKYFPLL